MVKNKKYLANNIIQVKFKESTDVINFYVKEIENDRIQSIVLNSSDKDSLICFETIDSSITILNLNNVIHIHFLFEPLGIEYKTEYKDEDDANSIKIKICGYENLRSEYIPDPIELAELYFDIQEINFESELNLNKFIGFTDVDGEYFSINKDSIIYLIIPSKKIKEGIKDYNIENDIETNIIEKEDTKSKKSRKKADS